MTYMAKCDTDDCSTFSGQDVCSYLTLCGVFFSFTCGLSGRRLVQDRPRRSRRRPHHLGFRRSYCEQCKFHQNLQFFFICSYNLNTTILYRTPGPSPFHLISHPVATSSGTSSSLFTLPAPPSELSSTLCVPRSSSPAVDPLRLLVWRFLARMPLTTPVRFFRYIPIKVQPLMRLSQVS